jgi:hypothetical protein
MRKLFLAASLLLLCGAGCDLSQKLDWKLPFSLNPSAEISGSAAASRSIALRPGLEFTVRPSVLGLSGSVDQVLGLDAQALRVTVKEAGAERRVLAWQGASASGTLALSAYADAQAMLLPAFWQTGEASASHNGGLWLSRAAYDDLSGNRAIDLKIGLADDALGSLAAALKTFNALSATYFGSATAVPELSPFTVKKTGAAEAFPLTIDGKIVLLKTIQASSWFADFVILDNPENPLILKVSVNPAAQPALKALESAHVRSDELGYEITSLTRP